MEWNGGCHYNDRSPNQAKPYCQGVTRSPLFYSSCLNHVASTFFFVICNCSRLWVVFVVIIVHIQCRVISGEAVISEAFRVVLPWPPFFIVIRHRGSINRHHLHPRRVE